MENDPENAEAHNKMGILLGRKGEVQEAVYAFERALRISPDVKYYLNLGNVLNDYGFFEQAIGIYKKTLEIDKNYIPAHRYLGMAYLRSGLREEGILQLQKALSLWYQYIRFSSV